MKEEKRGQNENGGKLNDWRGKRKN